MSRNSAFVVDRIIKIKDLVKGKVKELYESDLAIQDDKHIVQLKLIEREREKSFITPGIFTVVKTPMGGVGLTKSNLRERKLLMSVTNSNVIVDEANCFFSMLDTYKQLERAMKRSVLLYSLPGCGKTASITQFCNDACKEDPGTVVIIWPTTTIRSSEVHNFLSKEVKYKKECTRLILVIEDIGGAEYEGSSGPRGIDGSLLNLLDGIEVTFELPTFIIATTNFPENLLGALADRPGRFDLMTELKPPATDEKIQLLEFIAKRSLTEDEKSVFKDDATVDFSIAHLEEIVMRSILHRKTIRQVVNELVEHKKRFNAGFEKSRKTGFIRDDDDDF